MSRRDEMMRRLDDTLSTVQQEFNALSRPSAGEVPAPLSTRLGSAFQRISSQIRTPSSPISTSTSQSLREHPPRRPSSVAGDGRLSAPAESASNTATKPSPNGDDLPTYTRHAPPTLPVRPPTLGQQGRHHSFASRTGRLSLAVDSDTNHRAPVFYLNSADSRGGFVVSGSVTLDLRSPETIDALKIRVKGVVKTSVMRVHGGSGTRHPILDEVTFLDRGHTLFHTGATPLTYPLAPSGTMPPVERTNQSSDPTKLQGTFVFPFSLHVKNTVQLVRPVLYAREGTEYELPPSFSLSMAGWEQARGLQAISERASIQYYIKLTLSRHGLLRPNDRLFAPLIVLRNHPVPPISPPKLLTLRERGPVEEPTCWAGRKQRQEVRKGVVFGRRTAWYEVILMLPEPAIFSKDAIIPYRVRIVSSSPKDTTTFPLNQIHVSLIQRCDIRAQNAPDHQETAVAIGQSVEEGNPDGEAINGPAIADGAVWGKRIRGEFHLKSKLAPSFKAPNLICDYLVRVIISCPGPGNDTILVSPVRLVSIAQEEAAGGTGTGELNIDLPPSYYEVVEADDRRKSG
ncbi:hypothetical protein BT69DRAFT_1339985 [Atractiella rhizophila]|nr:hypothetical protein BT69DRAFT_1339985 [Atractiella rhizophila]